MGELLQVVAITHPVIAQVVQKLQTLPTMGAVFMQGRSFF